MMNHYHRAKQAGEQVPKILGLTACIVTNVISLGCYNGGSFGIINSCLGNKWQQREGLSWAQIMLSFGDKEGR